MIKNVTLKKQEKAGDWQDEGVASCSVRLKQDELFKGQWLLNGEDLEVRVPTGIPENDYNCVITLSDGQVVMGRLVHSKFEMT